MGEKKKSQAVESTGYAAGNYETVNKLFEEERFHAIQGHGFAAERANDHIDKLTGHFSKIVGDDNAKNGPDRWVNGSFIQTKYYSNARGSVNAGFENNGAGVYKYIGRFGKPMELEVPYDQYEQAVLVMKEKIINGQVPGVKNPEKAADIVRKGNVSYEQSVNIAKAGTFESIVYDTASGAVIGLSAGGISYLISYAIAVINGNGSEEAEANARKTGISIGARSAATSVIASQLSKAGLNSALVKSSEIVANAIGTQASATVANAFRSGANIYGAAAVKSCAKLIRGNVVSGATAVGVMSAIDLVRVGKGDLTTHEFKNHIAINSSTVGAGTVGFVAGQALIPIPVVGGLIGSFVVGMTAGKIVEGMLDSSEKVV